MTREMVDRYLEKARVTLEESRTLLDRGYAAGAVSRAYYAVVNAGCAALEARGVRVKTHRALMALFGLHFIKK